MDKIRKISREEASEIRELRKDFNFSFRDLAKEFHIHPKTIYQILKNEIHIERDVDIEDLIKDSISVIKNNEPPEGYYGCFSGGKDSVLLKHLVEIANVKVDWHYHVTTIDPPELIHFIKRYHSDVKFVRPKYGNFFYRAAYKKGFPTRKNRWCCLEYKEISAPKDKSLLMGIRKEESANRKKNWSSSVSTHYRTNNPVVLPILEWASDELWDYIQENKIHYCSLYDEGFNRLGCIGCPMAGTKRIMEFKRWPKYETKWKWVFETVWNRRTGTLQRDGRPWFGNAYFHRWEDMWDWWLNSISLPPPLLSSTTDIQEDQEDVEIYYSLLMNEAYLTEHFISKL